MQGLTFSGGSITLSAVIARRLAPSVIHLEHSLSGTERVGHT